MSGKRYPEPERMVRVRVRFKDHEFTPLVFSSSGQRRIWSGRGRDAEQLALDDALEYCLRHGRQPVFERSPGARSFC